MMITGFPIESRMIGSYNGAMRTRSSDDRIADVKTRNRKNC